MGLSVTMIALMFLSALAAIILVLLQPGNSTGINALGGSSETFFGKKVDLRTFVKVEPNWRNRESKLKAFGYIE